MTLPLFLFRDEDRNCVNLSTVDSRAELSEAELYHVVDIGQGTWCRPCQSTGCPHATRIEQILTMADLASERTSYEHLPGIERITRYRATGETVVAATFDTGAKVRYHETNNGEIHQLTFPAEDPKSPLERIDRPGCASAADGLIELLDSYGRYRSLGCPTGLADQHPAVARITTE